MRPVTAQLSTQSSSVSISSRRPGEERRCQAAYAVIRELPDGGGEQARVMTACPGEARRIVYQLRGSGAEISIVGSTTMISSSALLIRFDGLYSASRGPRRHVCWSPLEFLPAVVLKENYGRNFSSRHPPNSVKSPKETKGNDSKGKSPSTIYLQTLLSTKRHKTLWNTCLPSFFATGDWLQSIFADSGGVRCRCCILFM